MAPSDPRRQPSDEAESDAGERFGPVAVTRTVKDDGRALILFSREERAGEKPGQA